MKFAFRTIVGASLIVAATGAATAQSRPVPVRGQIQSYSAGAIEVVGRSGKTVVVRLAAPTQVVGVIRQPLSSIKIGDYVSSTAVRKADGSLEALQVSVLPASLKGANEGQKPWDTAPDSVMTNASISGVAAVAGKGELQLQFEGKSVAMNVPDDTPVVSFVPRDAGLLTPGATVFIVAMQDAKGELSADRIVAELDGVKPPM